MQDAVLQKNHRGHTAQDVRNAAKWITAAGFSLGLQMMIGLDGSTPEQERKTLQELLALHPDTLRIYPLVVLKGTELAERVQNGSFVLYDWETVLELCADALCHSLRTACRRYGAVRSRCWILSSGISGIGGISAMFTGSQTVDAATSAGNHGRSTGCSRLEQSGCRTSCLQSGSLSGSWGFVANHRNSSHSGRNAANRKGRIRCFSNRWNCKDLSPFRIG